MSPLEIALIVMVVMFIIGMPIYMSLCIAAAVTLVCGDILPLTIIHNSLFDGLNLFPLLAIPCFVVAGTLMEYGNITNQIIDVVKQIVGRTYGGLGITTILACTFFAAISGSFLAFTATAAFSAAAFFFLPSFFSACFGSATIFSSAISVFSFLLDFFLSVAIQICNLPS